MDSSPLNSSSSRSLKLISEQFLCCTALKNFDWQRYKFIMHSLLVEGMWQRRLALFGNDVFLPFESMHNNRLQDIFDKFLSDDYDGCQLLQDRLFNETVGHDLNVKFPLPKNYQHDFLKRIIFTLEEKQIEVTESFYAKLREFLSTYVPHSDFKFKHYKLPDGKFITLSESTAIISEGTTGLCSWQGAFVLAEWCLKNSDSLRDKKILELGSGIGLTGLVVCFSCHPKYYLFSDIHESVLSQLCLNININCSDFDSNIPRSAKFYSSDNNKWLNTLYNDINIQVWKLDWFAPFSDDAFLSLDLPDIILAADVVYDPSLILPLCNVLNTFLEKKTDTQIIFACTVRSSETHELFLSTLSKLGMTAKMIHYDWNPVFHYNVLGTIKLYSINKDSS